MPIKSIHSVLFGVAVGDALGVPVEFKSRDYLKQNPVRDMFGFGTHNQPAGTWSDDSSLTFCLAEMLCGEYNLQNLAHKFIYWYNDGYWTPHGEVFDVGIATSQAIRSLNNGINPILAGLRSEDSNGNGSLIRILPLVFYVKHLTIEKRFQVVQEISSLTHAHIRSVLACFIYMEMALQLLKYQDKWKAYTETVKTVNTFLNNSEVCSQEEINLFHRILCNPIGDYNIISLYECQEDEIHSSGYVLNSLEASIWCLLKYDSFQTTVLKAVNLGEDTDTTGAITGGLAGLLYGFESIPSHWIEILSRKDDIIALCYKLE